MSSGNVFRFSVKKGDNDSQTLVDMNAVEEIVSLSKTAEELGKNLENELNSQGLNILEKDALKEFIIEQIGLTEKDGQLRHVQLLDEDGLADLIIEKGKNFAEVKCEYYLGKDNWQICKDLSTIYINSDYPNFDEAKNKALEFGIKKVESTVSKAVQCEELTELMKVESAVTENPIGVFFPHAYNKEQAIKLINLNGVVSAKAWAKVGGAVAISKNFVDVFTGEKTVGEAAKSIATSTAKEMLIDYAKSILIKEAVGQPIVKAALRVGGETLTKTLASTPAGTAISGISAVNAAVGATAKSALLSSSGLAIGAINSAGGLAAAAASSFGLTGAATAITTGTGLVTGGIGAAVALATPLAPIVAGGALLYGAGKLLKKIF